jgi:hypothetical protein
MLESTLIIDENQGKELDGNESVRERALLQNKSVK